MNNIYICVCVWSDNERGSSVIPGAHSKAGGLPDVPPPPKSESKMHRCGHDEIKSFT